ncbi:MAG: gliding motility-associated C-terminal domain-containing protein [Flavobacteriales bacterium]|nr:gliding motility-associated C-terminal domain-containing protein [Flavobacteriales bacterium]MBK7100800.1 gliding motility-associated C-terminal domain-containing protein [Flavobacteriales bacterium]MBK7484157.1 gliding motility-associated C-terminal domain-containing protein [Flavobacteriales bacterium]MBK7618352.1 gliding motility-associated C-terminal domain-containing protein [Flavobacteriales bacterium]MBK8709241.1 gliding motility-associated C-terminal domain-containing protein [Flavob
MERPDMKYLLSLSALALFPAWLLAGTEDHGHEHPQARSFVENLGQWPAPVLFRADVNGAAVFVERTGWTWAKLEESASAQMHDIALLSPEEQARLQFNGHAWRMRFEGATAPTAVGMDKAETYHNYFLGNDQSRWRSRVGVYGGVTQRSVWPDIDVVLSKVDGNFKYDVMLAPGADPGKVALAYDGLDGMALGKNGELILTTSVGDVTELAPVAFYGDGAGESIPCVFVLDGSTVRFAFPKGVDGSRSVVIDPVLVAATYSGGTNNSNYGHCATYDNAGGIYTGARNFGPTYPASVGAFQTAFGGGGTDISLSKYNPDGSEQIWAAYLGGSSGENPHSLITNAAGELIVLGSTNSGDFPITASAFDQTLDGQDIVVVHIAADGSNLIGSTFLGGSGSDGTNEMNGNYGEAFRGEVFTDALGNILITSFTNSNDFPVTDGALQVALGGGQDGVVAKLDPQCSSLLASTYLGGSSDDSALGLRIAGNGEIFVTGATASSDFAVGTGGYVEAILGGTDGYVVRLSSDLTTRVAGTFFGTTEADRSYFIDTDSNDDVWIYGQTYGIVPVFPAGTYGATGGKIFIAKISGDLSDAPITTMIPGNLAPVAFLVDVCDHVYISGYEAIGDLPLTPDALYSNGSFYLASFDVDMSDILFGTHYGGSHVDGGTSRFDKNGIVYQGVCSGGQSMQTTSWAYEPTNFVSWDIGVFKIDFETAGVQANINADSQTGCVPATFNLTAVGQAQEFTWDLNDGSPILTGNEVSVTYTEIGTYVVMLIGSDPGACNLADTTYITLNVYDPDALLAAFEVTPVSSCDGYFLELTNTSVGATQYQWTFGDGATANGFAPSHEYSGPGTYTVGLTVLNSICVDTTDTAIPVTFIEPVLPFQPASPVAICDGVSVQLSAGSGFDTYTWSTGASTQNINVQEVGDYVVTVTDGFCEASGTIQVIAAPPPPPTPDVVKCMNASAVLLPGFPVNSIQWDNGAITTSITVSEAGVYGFAAEDQYGCDVEGAVLVIQLPSERPNNFIPNVFTPNGDLKNDRFEVVADGLEQFHMEVYDRWGMMMFETSNQTSGWNGGLDNGASAVPDGTYYYVIDFRDLCSNEPSTTRTGHVTLLR